MDRTYSTDLASSLYIKGGFINNMTNTRFLNHSGSNNYYTEVLASKFSRYFPTLYYKYAQAPIVRIMIEPKSFSSSRVLNFTSHFLNSSFMFNRHIQVLGLGFDRQFYGSLVSMETFYETGEQYAPQLTLERCNIRDNQFIGNQTSLFYLFKGLLQVTRSQFYGNGYVTEDEIVKQKIPSNAQLSFPYQSYIYQQWQQIGMFYMMGMEQFPKGYFHQILNNSFQFTFGHQGCLFAFKIDFQDALFQNNFYSYNFVSVEGTAFFGRNQNGRTNIKFVNESMNYMFSDSAGAISCQPRETNYLSVLIYNSTFRNCFAKEGAAIYLDAMAAVIVNNCTFIRDSWHTNRTAFIEGQFKGSSMRLNDFIDYKYLNDMVNKPKMEVGQIYMEESENLDAVVFQNEVIKNASDPFISYSEIVNCQFISLSADYGAAILIGDEMKIKVWNTPGSRRMFFNNTANLEGIIKIQSETELYGENLLLINNTSKFRGSAITIYQAQAFIVNSKFEGNVAYDRGTIYVFTDSVFECDYCEFSRNYAQGSSAIFALDNMKTISAIRHSSFINNTHQSNLVNLILSQVIFENTTFIDNTAEKVNHGITMINSQVTVNSITVNYTNELFLTKNTYSVDSGFFSLNFQSKLTITGNTRISNCRGATASVLYATGSSIVEVGGNTSFSNCASQSGSTFYILMTDSVQIFNATFFNNSQSDLEILKAKANVTNTVFINSNAQSINAQNSNISLSNVSFLNSTNQNILGKALYCKCDSLNIVNSTFYNQSALEGGAIFLTSVSKSSHFIISNSNFTECKALHGGAIKVQDAGQFILMGNRFSKNQALLPKIETQVSQKLIQKGLGGALNLDCWNQDLGLDSNCHFNISNKNIFTSNQAEHDGGAIIWIANNISMDLTNAFTNNTAPYGQDIASYPKSIIVQFVDNNDYYNRINNYDVLFSSQTNKRQLDSSKSYQFSSIVSGMPFMFYVYILDQSGKLYATESKSVASLKTTATGIIFQNQEIQAKQGIFNFSNPIITMTPGNKANFTLVIDGLQTFGNSIDFLQVPIKIEITARKCSIGEQYTIDNRCLQCTEGEYLYTAPSQVTQCQKCPDSAVCYGLNIVAPKPGFWRSSNISEDFTACPNPAACLGGNQTNLLGECSDGYNGVACGNCLPGYKKQSQFKCNKCPSMEINSLQFVGLLFVGILLCSFLVRSALQNANKEKPIHSVYLKIMTNHFQMIGAIAAIEFHFPSEIQAIQGGQGDVSSITDSLFSFDCFIQDAGISDQSDRVYLQKVIFYSLLPLILCLVSIGFWSIIAALNKMYYGIKDKLICTMVVLLFLIHPNIAKALFSAFNCMEIEGEHRLKDNVDMICYEGKHLLYLLLIIIPSLIIWVFGIPLAALILLIKNKAIILQLDNFVETSKVEQHAMSSIKLKYGFLFNGYKLNTYFWEVVILYRKILIVMTTVFLSVVSSETQVLVVIFIIVVAMILHIHFQPFNTPILNKMELYSLQVAGLTMYGGLFYVTGNHYTYMDNNGLKWFFLLFILIPNIAFFSFWLYHMRLEILKQIYMKSSRLFRLITCGCINPAEFEAKHVKPKRDLEVYELKKQSEDRSGKIGQLDEAEFSNVIMSRKQFEDNSFQSQASISDSDFAFAKSGKPDRLGDQEFETKADPQDVKLDFPQHMLRKVTSKDSQKQIKGSQGPPQKKIIIPQFKQLYEDESATQRSHIMSSRKVMPETMANLISSRIGHRDFDHTQHDQSQDYNTQVDVTRRSFLSQHRFIPDSENKILELSFNQEQQEDNSESYRKDYDTFSQQKVTIKNNRIRKDDKRHQSLGRSESVMSQSLADINNIHLPQNASHSEKESSSSSEQSDSEKPKRGFQHFKSQIQEKEKDDLKWLEVTMQRVENANKSISRTTRRNMRRNASLI